jgi:hypothetical protein
MHHVLRLVENAVENAELIFPCFVAAITLISPFLKEKWV